MDIALAIPQNARSAMGEYIVPPGGKPLTSLCDSSPAPADYFPKVDLTKPAAPQYSITGPHKLPKCDYQASAADHNVSKDMTWSRKTISLNKGKGKTRPYDIRDDAHLTASEGPARYQVEHNGFGVGGPRYSVAARHEVNAGPPNRLVQPVDTHGNDNPGPNYRPNSGYWGRGPKKSFGIGRPGGTDHNPGPAEYSISDSAQGAAYSLAKRLPPPLICQQAVNKVSPGPASYELGTTIGMAQAKSVGARTDVKVKPVGPAPNLYHLPNTINDAQAAKLTYRPFEHREVPHPGPTQYSIRDSDLPKAPKFSMRNNGKPSFPDILHYPLIAQKHSTPGPGHYEIPGEIQNNDNPKFSIRQRAKTPTDEVPGPNHYKMKEQLKELNSRSPPRYSMASRFEPIDKRVSPGPAAYNPTVNQQGTTGGYSMTGRPRTTRKFCVPAANAYAISKGRTRKGSTTTPAVSLKSRASPFVFSGFQSNRIHNG